MKLACFSASFLCFVVGPFLEFEMGGEQKKSEKRVLTPSRAKTLLEEALFAKGKASAFWKSEAEKLKAEKLEKIDDVYYRAGRWTFVFDKKYEFLGKFGNPKTGPATAYPGLVTVHHRQTGAAAK